MTINKVLEGEKLTVAPEGRIDTTTADEFSKSLDITGIKELFIDFEKVQYISSAGLRVLLNTQKNISAQGKMIIKNANESIMEVFEITGFADILNIE